MTRRELTIPRLHSKNDFLSCLHSSGSSSWWFLRHSDGVRGGSDRSTQSVRNRHSARLDRMFWQDCNVSDQSVPVRTTIRLVGDRLRAGVPC